MHLQLSSPIEEGKISEVYDELNSDSAPEGSFVTFNGVETSTATLTVSVDDADIPLGSSRPQDLAPLCAIDPLEAKDDYVTEFRVAIVGEDAHSASAAASEMTGEDNESESMDVAPEPLCTVTFKVTYKPSPKDQREALYEVLNKTSQRKASALENLRKISMAMSRELSSAPPNKAAGTVAKPSVKPGFLNKKKSTEPTRMQKLYENTIGPNSMLVKGFSIALVARNYLLFFGAVVTFHFKGQLLSLPPPV